MSKPNHGSRHFYSDIFPRKEDFFERLAEGQRPRVIFLDLLEDFVPVPRPKEGHR